MNNNIDWSKVPFGTKVRIEDYFIGNKKFHNRYFVGIFEPTYCLEVSKIKNGDEFTGLTVKDYGICDCVKPEQVSIHPTVKIKSEWLMQ